MPIDDIHYLQSHSIKEHVMVLVDSVNRDRERWISPNNFCIEFPEPFTNVVGVEILNASIPRTMFMVDGHCNTLEYKFGLHCFCDNNKIIHLTKRNYDLLDKFFENISDKIQEENDSNQEYIATVLGFDQINTIVNTEIDEDIKDLSKNRPILKMKMNTPFLLDMGVSTSKIILGFDELTDINEMDLEQRYIPLELFVKNPTSFYVIKYDELTNNISTISLPNFDEPYIFNSNIVFYLDRSTNTYTGNFRIHNNNSMTQEYYIKHVLIKFQNIILLSDTYIDSNEKSPNDIKLYTYDSKLSFHFDMNHIIPNKNMIYPDNIECTVYIEYNYLSNIGSNTFTNIKKVFTCVEDDHLVNSNILTYTYGIESDISSIYDKPIYYIKVFCNINNDNKNYKWFKLKGQNNYTTYFKCTKVISDDINDANTYEYHSNLHTIKGNEIYNPFGKIILNDIDDMTFNYNDVEYHYTSNDLLNDIHILEARYLEESEYTLIAPGIINLSADNYIILRCDEIENQIQGSFIANHTSPGIGLFNINYEGYTTTNMNFFSTTNKEFHPIGKLSKLHFKFEQRYKNILYDFKGANVSFVLLIKYLKPQSVEPKFDKYKLNPNYNPDTLQNICNDYNIDSYSDITSDESNDDDTDDSD